MHVIENKQTKDSNQLIQIKLQGAETCPCFLYSLKDEMSLFVLTN